MALALRVNGLDAEGVRLISPAAPDFDELGRPLMGERIAHVGLQLKPMLVIASNESPQTIVSLSLIRAFLDEQSRGRRAGKMPSYVRDPQAIWRQQAAAEAASWRRKFKDEEIPQLLNAAIRLEPFLIRRRAASLR